MSGSVLVAVAVAVACVLALLVRRDADRVPHPAGRTGLAWRGAGTVGGLAAGAAVAWWGDLGSGLLLAVPVLGLGVVLGVIAAELAVRAPHTPVRTADLHVRTVTDQLPRRPAAIVAGSAALLLAVLVLTTALGSPDDLGRPGRWLARACGAGRAAALGPWPGSAYTLPLAGVLAVGMLAAAVALAVIVRRPRSGAARDLDDGARSRAAAVDAR